MEAPAQPSVSAKTLLLLVAAAVGFACVFAAYVCCQRALVSGRRLPCDPGKRLWWSVPLTHGYIAALGVIVWSYEASRTGMLGAEAVGHPAFCRAILFMPYFVPPLGWFYIWRGLRLAVLFEPRLRPRYGWLVAGW